MFKKWQWKKVHVKNKIKFLKGVQFGLKYNKFLKGRNLSLNL